MSHRPMENPAFALPSPRGQVLPSAENLCKSILVIGLLLASFYGSRRVATAVAAAELHPVLAFALEWGAIGAFAILSGIFVTAMIALAHEAVHRVLFRSSFWNELWGGLLSALSLVPLHANRQFHLTQGYWRSLARLRKVDYYGSSGESPAPNARPQTAPPSASVRGR